MTMNKIISLLKRNLRSIIGIVIGAAGGAAYYHFVGCRTGTCPLTSNIYIMLAYGALLGYLLSGILKIKRPDGS